MVSASLKQAVIVENTLKTRSKSNLEYLLSQLSDTDSESSEAKPSSGFDSQFIKDVTFHKNKLQMSKMSSRSESELSKVDLFKTSNFEYLLSCLDEPLEAESLLRDSLLRNQFFIRVKNIELDKRSIVSKTKIKTTKSTKVDYLKNLKSLKISDISLLKATVNEIAPVEKEHALNIGSSVVILESPIMLKLVHEFEYPFHSLVNQTTTNNLLVYNQNKKINNSQRQSSSSVKQSLNKDHKLSTHLQSSSNVYETHQKVINEMTIRTKVTTNIASNFSNILEAVQSEPIRSDGLIMVKIVKKVTWPNIFGIQLASFMCSKELLTKFKITGFSQDGVVKHLAALDLKNLIGMQIERINGKDFVVHSAMSSGEAEAIIESLYGNANLIEITVKNIL